KEISGLPIFRDRFPFRTLRGKRLAGEADDFHRPDHAPGILFVNLLVSRRIAFAQLTEQRLERRRLQLGAQSGIRGRCLAQPADEGLEIKSRATAENWPSSPRLHVCNCGVAP